VVLPQLQQLQRPFDKLRLLVRKLCHSAQAGVLVPTGPALEELAQRVHRAHVAMHGYDLTPLEGQLAEALQTHSLLIWDTLHAFGQNHFGRLIHFPPSASPQPSPRAQPLPPSHAARLAAQLALSQGGGSPASLTSTPAGIGSPASLGSPAQHDTPPQKTAAPGSVAPPNAAPYAFDPVHHDWRQIELMVRHSIACSEALPAPATDDVSVTSTTGAGEGESGADGIDGSKEKDIVKHSRSDVAIAVMHHVLRCAIAIQTGMELGAGPCLSQILTALKEFKDALEALSLKFSKEESQLQEAADDGDGDTHDGTINKEKGSSDSSIDEQLLSKLLSVLPTSPLLQWLSLNGGRKELATMMGSRMGSLLDILKEIVRHTKAEGLFRSYIHPRASGDGGGGTDKSADDDGEESAVAPAARVAVVVGDKHSGNEVKLAIESVPEFHGTTVSHWMGSTPPRREQEGEEKDDKNVEFDIGEDSHLAIWLLTADEATSTSGRTFISQCNEAVWFSASDVLHAAGFDYESSALSVFCRTSAVGNVSATLSKYIPGPECHVLATGAQTAAWLEVCRADQLLLAAMQLVQAGDASFEGYLGQIMTNPIRSTWENMSVPPPAAVLHTLCLGLCGTPPQFHILKNTSNALHIENKKAVYQAMAVLPEDLLAPGNYALPVAFGSEEITFQGPFEESEAEARDAAAEVALSALVECGLVAAYWQTRVLLVQSQQATAAAVADLEERMQQQCLFVSSPAPDTMPASPFVDAAARTTSPTHQRPGIVAGVGAFPGKNVNSDNDDVRHRNPVVPTDRLICPTCGIVTTSEGHLKEHLAGRRHLKNLERVQQQQQGATIGPARFAAGGDSSDAVDSGQENKIVGADGGATNEDGPEPRFQSRRTKSGIDGSSSSSVSITSPRASAKDGQLSSLCTIDRLPSSLSDAFVRRSSSSLHRHSSGNVYEGFPCVRVGDVILPSSMDLRAFLDEMQQAGELELPAGSGGASILGLANAHNGSLLESLPSIDETAQSIGGSGSGNSGSSKHLMTSVSTSGNPNAAASAAGAKQGVGGGASNPRVPHLNFRGSNGETTGGSSVGSEDSGSYNRNGRPPSATRPGSAHRPGSGGGGSGGGGGFSSQYRGGHHQQQYQQQQRTWNNTYDVGSVSPNQQRQRYSSRFAQDGADLSTGGGGGGNGGVGGAPNIYGMVGGEGGGGFPAGVMAYQTTPMAYPHSPHTVHGQHIIQQPVAFIPASMNIGYHPNAIASPAGMAGVGMMGIPGNTMATGVHAATAATTTFVAMPTGSAMPAGAMMHRLGGEYVPAQPRHYHQYPSQHQYLHDGHNYQEQQQNAQYYGVRSPSQQQHRGGPAFRRQQQQQ